MGPALKWSTPLCYSKAIYSPVKGVNLTRSQNEEKKSFFYFVDAVPIWDDGCSLGLSWPSFYSVWSQLIMLYAWNIPSALCPLCVRAQLPQSCLTLGKPMDCSPPGSFVHGILQARILDWVAISCSRGSPSPRDQTHKPNASCIAGRFFTAELQGSPVCPLYLNKNGRNK